MTNFRVVFPFILVFLMLLENCYSTKNKKQSTSSPCSDPSKCVDTSTEAETTTHLMPTEEATCISLTDCVDKASRGRLVGFEIKVTNHSGIGSCYKECVGRVYCKSFNYHMETGLCELQSAVPKNTTSGNFTNYDGFINILKPNVTYAHPCLKRTCKNDEYCVISISNERFCLKECTIPLPKVLNGKQEQEGTSNSVFTVGKQITYTCANGSRGPTIVKGRCLFSGEWSSGNCVPNYDFEILNSAWLLVNDTFKMTLAARVDTTSTFIDSTVTSLPLVTSTLEATSTLKANSSLVKNITSKDNSSLSGNLTHTDNSSLTDNSTIPNNSSVGNCSLINGNSTSVGNSSANNNSSTSEDRCVTDFSRPRNKSNSEFAYLDICAVPVGGTAQLVSPIILPGQTVAMSYLYYQRGDGLTHFVYMQAKHDNGTVEIRKFAPVSGNNGDEWKIQNYKVAPAETSFVLVLEATRKTNATVDLAIDDIKMTIL